SNPTLSARHAKGAIGPFCMSDGDGLVDEPARLTQGVPPFALRAIGCADVRFGSCLHSDKIARSDFGQRSWPSRSEGESQDETNNPTPHQFANSLNCVLLFL
ncbi:MAG: hypothetical protein ACREPT_05220, partial [Rudaea sp.]